MLCHVEFGSCDRLSSVNQLFLTGKLLVLTYGTNTSTWKKHFWLRWLRDYCTAGRPNEITLNKLRTQLSKYSLSGTSNAFLQPPVLFVMWSVWPRYMRRGGDIQHRLRSLCKSRTRQAPLIAVWYHNVRFRYHAEIESIIVLLIRRHSENCNRRNKFVSDFLTGWLHFIWNTVTPISRAMLLNWC